MRVRWPQEISSLFEVGMYDYGNDVDLRPTKGEVNNDCNDKELAISCIAAELRKEEANEKCD